MVELWFDGDHLAIIEALTDSDVFEYIESLL
jgi:hypothetical protein